MKAHLLLCAYFLTATAFAQGVLVVDDDPGPGVDFNSIQDAINAAAPSEIVLVRAGSYSESLLVDGKSLVVQAEPGVEFSSFTSILVRNLGPGDEVVLRGLEVDATTNNQNEILQLRDNAGDVWVEDCTFIGSVLAFFSTPDTVVIDDCANVVLSTSTVIGGTAVVLTGGRGIAATNSSVFLQDMVVHGGGGTSGAVADGEVGGAGVTLTAGFLFANEATVQGGMGGGSGSIFGCGTPGDGGPGLELRAGAQAFLRNTSLLGGPGGVPEAGCTNDPGADGPPDLIVSGTLQQTTAPMHSVDVTSPVRTDETAQIDVVGVPGELAFMLYSTGLQPVFFPGLFDALLPGAPIAQFAIGVLDVNGTASLQVQPNLPVGTQGRSLFTQALFFELGSQTVTFGPPRVVVLLDAAL